MPINSYPFPASHVLKSLQFSQAASYQTSHKKERICWAVTEHEQRYSPGVCVPEVWGLQEKGCGLWDDKWNSTVACSCSSKALVWVVDISQPQGWNLSSSYVNILHLFFVNAVWSNWRAGDILSNLSTWEMMTLDLFNQILSRLRVQIAELVSHKELCCSLGSNPSPETRGLWQDILHSSARGITARSFHCNSSIYQATQLSGGWREDKGNDSVCRNESLTTWGLFLLLAFLCFMLPWRPH